MDYDVGGSKQHPKLSDNKCNDVNSSKVNNVNDVLLLLEIQRKFESLILYIMFFNYEYNVKIYISGIQNILWIVLKLRTSLYISITSIYSQAEIKILNVFLLSDDNLKRKYYPE